MTNREYLIAALEGSRDDGRINEDADICDMLECPYPYKDVHAECTPLRFWQLPDRNMCHRCKTEWLDSLNSDPLSGEPYYVITDQAGVPMMMFGKVMAFWNRRAAEEHIRRTGKLMEKNGFINFTGQMSIWEHFRDDGYKTESELLFMTAAL